MHIILNAFSFLREKLTQNGFPYLNASLEIKEGMRVVDVIEFYGFGTKFGRSSFCEPSGCS